MFQKYIIQREQQTVKKPFSTYVREYEVLGIHWFVVKIVEISFKKQNKPLYSYLPSKRVYTPYAILVQLPSYTIINFSSLNEMFIKDVPVKVS